MPSSVGSLNAVQIVHCRLARLPNSVGSRPLNWLPLATLFQVIESAANPGRYRAGQLARYSTCSSERLPQFGFPPLNRARASSPGREPSEAGIGPVSWFPHKPDFHQVRLAMSDWSPSRRGLVSTRLVSPHPQAIVPVNWLSLRTKLVTRSW